MAVATTGESHGLFWNSNNGDRTYDATSFEYWLKKFFTSGVFNGDMQVLASSGMTVTVGTGYSNSDGKPKRWAEQTELTLSPANSLRPRIDTIVITRDNIARDIFLEVITGAYSSDTPVPTPPVRNDDKYQLVLAQILVEAGVTEITQSKITDTRVDADLCGYITGTVEELDFEAFTLQFQAYFAEFESTNLAEFNEWFANLHYVLDGDVAGHLQNEIDELKHSSGSNANLAPVEKGTTATSPYAAGEHVVVNNVYHEVTAAIAVGDTFVEGTNIDVRTVGAEIEALKQNSNVRWNPTTKMYQVYFEGQWYDDHYFNPVWDGYIFNNGQYSTEYFAFDFNTAQTIGLEQSHTNTLNPTNFVLSELCTSSAQYGTSPCARIWTFTKPIRINRQCRIKITFTFNAPVPPDSNKYGTRFYIKTNANADTTDVLLQSGAFGSSDTEYTFDLRSDVYVGRYIYLAYKVGDYAVRPTTLTIKTIQMI